MGDFSPSPDIRTGVPVLSGWVEGSGKVYENDSGFSVVPETCVRAQRHSRYRYQGPTVHTQDPDGVRNLLRLPGHSRRSRVKSLYVPLSQ